MWINKSSKTIFTVRKLSTSVMHPVLKKSELVSWLEFHWYCKLKAHVENLLKSDYPVNGINCYLIFQLDRSQNHSWRVVLRVQASSFAGVASQPCKAAGIGVISTADEDLALQVHSVVCPKELESPKAKPGVTLGAIGIFYEWVIFWTPEKEKQCQRGTEMLHKTTIADYCGTLCCVDSSAADNVSILLVLPIDQEEIGRVVWIVMWVWCGHTGVQGEDKAIIKSP